MSTHDPRQNAIEPGPVTSMTTATAQPAGSAVSEVVDKTPTVNGRIARWCRRVSAAPAFQNLILGVIIANAVAIGLETSVTLVRWFGPWLNLLNHLAQAIFTIELAIRLTACWPRPLRFFRLGWNSFDFIVVAIAFVPATGGLSNLARLARVARATRIISALPQLRLVFETILRSIPSMAHILILLAMFLYVYGVVGFHLFASDDPEHWGSLGAALLTLFQVLTLEGWYEIHGAVRAAHPASWLFFTSFIVVAVWVVMSLFVAVVVSNLEAVKTAAAQQFDVEVPGRPMAHIADIRAALTRLEQDIRLVSQAVRDAARDPSE